MLDVIPELDLIWEKPMVSGTVNAINLSFVRTGDNSAGPNVQAQLMLCQNSVRCLSQRDIATKPRVAR